MDLVTTQDNTQVQLFAGDFPRVLVPIVIVSGAGELAKGTVLGKITATGKYDAYDDTDNTGLEVAKVILSEDIDATSADVKCQSFASGHFNEAALTGYDAAAGVDFEGTPIFIGSAQ